MRHPQAEANTIQAARPPNALKDTNDEPPIEPGRKSETRNAPPDSPVALLRRRRRTKFIRFVLVESLAVAVMIGFGLAGMASDTASESLTPLFRILPIAAAVAATLIPILFYGFSGRRPRG